MTDNRTTELRAKLTERGVDWTKPKSAAEFIQTTFLHDGWGIEVLERNIGLCVTATNVFDTPEQAIAATLGSGTCELVETDSYSNANEVIHVLECSECGRTCEHVNGSYPRCPHCGARVRGGGDD